MALRQQMQRITRQQKLNRMSGSAAMRIAKGRKDPVALKVIKFKTLWKKWSKKLMQKYGQKGKMAARKSAMRTQNEGNYTEEEMDQIMDSMLLEMGDDLDSVYLEPLSSNDKIEDYI